MVLLLLFTACNNDPYVESMYLSGGNWRIHRAEEFNATVDGFALTFDIEQRRYFYCMYDCTGTIKWPTSFLHLDSDESYLYLSSFEKISVKAHKSNIVTRNVRDIELQGVYTDVLVDAEPNATISILASHGDVDVNLPSQQWKTRLFGDEVINQVNSSVKDMSGYLEVYSINGIIRVVEVQRVSQMK